jgi:hypothetical protein
MDYDIIGVFGVEYSYDELDNFINHFETINPEDIGYDDICNGNKYIIEKYFDVDLADYTYLFGYKLSCYNSPTEIHNILKKENEIKKRIKKFSEKYNVINKENEIMLRYLLIKYKS